MLGISVHGLLGVDADLQQSAFAAREYRSVEYHSVRVVDRHGDCNRPAPPASRTRT